MYSRPRHEYLMPFPGLPDGRCGSRGQRSRTSQQWVKISSLHLPVLGLVQGFSGLWSKSLSFGPMMRFTAMLGTCLRSVPVIILVVMIWALPVWRRTIRKPRRQSGALCHCGNPSILPGRGSRHLEGQGSALFLLLGSCGLLRGWPTSQQGEVTGMR